MKPAVRAIVLVWVVLMALLAATFASSYLDLGAGNLALSLVIAGLKSLLVVAVFMKLGESAPVVRLAIGVGLFVLALLLGLGAVDFASRDVKPAPWQSPAQLPAVTSPLR